MKSNPILEEVWRVKDELAREAGYDLHRLCENTRQWAAQHPHPGRVIHSSEEMRQLLAEKEHERDKQSATTLNDKPPHKP